MTRDSWREAFGDESRSELEEIVPTEVADRVWPRLAVELAAQPARTSRGPRRLVGALAACLALCLGMVGWLAAENRMLRQQAPAAPVVVVAPVLDDGGRQVTAGDLMARLSTLPPETRVLTAAEATELFARERPLLHALLRGPELDRLVADGLTAREAVSVLGRLDESTPVNLGRDAWRRARTRS